MYCRRLNTEQSQGIYPGCIKNRTNLKALSMSESDSKYEKNEPKIVKFKF